MNVTARKPRQKKPKNVEADMRNRFFIIKGNLSSGLIQNERRLRI
jgi:hypothetical protein